MRTKIPTLARNINRIRYLSGVILGLKKRNGEQKLLPVQKFGEFVHRAKSTISAWESGDRSPDSSEIGVICYVFHVDREQLLHGEIQELGPLALKRTWPPQEQSSKLNTAPSDSSPEEQEWEEWEREEIEIIRQLRRLGIKELCEHYRAQGHYLIELGFSQKQGLSGDPATPPAPARKQQGQR